MEFSVAFWNLQNLFDVNSSEIATDLEFIPEKGWTAEVLSKKIENLSKPLRIMNNGNPPDLFGFCEIESEKLARDLCERVRPGYYEIAKFIDDRILEVLIPVWFIQRISLIVLKPNRFE